MAGESEATLLNRVMLAVTNVGARIFRNQVGLGWQGRVSRFTTVKQITVHPGDVLVRDARALKSGLCNGASDLIGWKSIEITPAMAGKRIAVFVAIETKSDTGKLTDEQENFLIQVLSAGGIGIAAYDVDLTSHEVLAWIPK